MTRVGIIGPGDREEMTRLAIRIEERGAEAAILDSRVNSSLRVAPGEESLCGVPLAEFTAFYVADLGLPSPVARGPDGEVDRAASERALAHSRRRLAAWDALLARLELRCTVVNPYRTHDIHALKPHEAEAYIRLGLPVPYARATSDAEALLALPEVSSASWIRKGMVGGSDYTEAYVPPLSLEEARTRLRLGPIMVQERIEGDNLRAFVLDGAMIGAAEVISHSGSETDTRRGRIRVRRVDLPEEASRAAVAAAACWGMSFGAVDFMIDARSGRYCILECNSAPFFVNFERMSGHPIASRLAEYLCRRRPGAA